MKFNFPKIQLLLSTIFLIVCGASFFFLLKKVTNNDVLTKNKDEIWSKEAARRDEIKKINNSIKLIASEKENIEIHFAKSSDIVPFLDSVEELATKVNADAEVTSVDILDNSSKLIVGMKVSGSFESIYRFLLLLENSSYEIDFMAMDIQNINKQGGVSANNKSSGSWEAYFKLKLLSFVR